MAKKKGKNNGNSTDTAERADSMEPQPDTTENTSESQQLEQQLEQQEKLAVEDMDVEQLRAELNSARAEIARLEAELSKSGERDAPLKTSKPQEVQDLQEKLQRLRKEQQEADAARDKAWKQLKSVVQEISSLANPDYLQSLQVKAHD